MISQKTRTIIIWVVLVVWVLNFGAGIVVKDHKPSESVNAVFMLIVGTLFALGRNDPPPPPGPPPAVEAAAGSPPEEGA